MQLARALLSGCTLAALLASCASPRPLDAAADARAVIDELIAADNLLDLDGAMECYTADAVLLPPQGDAVRGKTAIRERYTSQFEAWRPELRAVHEKTVVAEGEAVDRGRTLGKLVSTSGGPDKRVDDAYEAKLRLERGVWRIGELRWKPSAR